MAAKSGKAIVPAGWDASLKKAFNDADQWAQNFLVTRDRLGEVLATLRSELDTVRPFIPAISTLSVIANAYSTQACTRAVVADKGQWSIAFSHAVEFRALDFRKIASLSLPFHKQTVLPFWYSMKAVGPAMVSQWQLAELLAKLLIAIAEKDARIDPYKTDSWQRGTNDAFLVLLFSEAFSIPISYVPNNPLVSEYQAVLLNWRTNDPDKFRPAMSAAADFHISRSRDGTKKMVYEFESTFDRVYPAELLVIQALRRRDGLPEIETGHLLIDKPWSLIRDMPEVTPHPLAVEAVSRLRADRPDFR
jgi:hypothetical protein